MALREIRLDTDPILRKKSRHVKEINDNIKILVEDMYETMYNAQGVGLAAPQVGILKRVIVVDTGVEGENYALINPKIVSEDGENLGPEACLSVPGYQGDVQRPKSIIVEFDTLDGKKETIEAKDFFARAICHEIDHLEGILYTDRASNLYEIQEEDPEDEEI